MLTTHQRIMAEQRRQQRRMPLPTPIQLKMLAANLERVDPTDESEIIPGRMIITALLRAKDQA